MPAFPSSHGACAPRGRTSCPPPFRPCALSSPVPFILCGCPLGHSSALYASPFLVSPLVVFRSPLISPLRKRSLSPSPAFPLFLSVPLDGRRFYRPSSSLPPSRVISPDHTRFSRRRTENVALPEGTEVFGRTHTRIEFECVRENWVTVSPFNGKTANGVEAISLAT